MSKRQLTISSNTLFHFTSNIENVLSILQYGFRPHFCLENLNFIFSTDPYMRKRLIHAFPMVCFCDIPLSQTKNHMKTYGEYGIGLRKKWGIKNNISPVLYAHRESKIIKITAEISSKVNKNFKQNNIDEDFREDILTALIKIYSMIKPYKGKLWRNGSYTKILRFYNEREWRFVPSEGPFKKGMPQDIFLNEAEREIYNKKLWKQEVLRFKPSDIKYLIVSKEEEIIDFIKEIEQIKSEYRYNPDEIKLLCSRVISSEQIYEDF